MSKPDLALIAAINLQCRLHAHSGDTQRLKESLAEWAELYCAFGEEVADRCLAPGCAKPLARKTEKQRREKSERLIVRANKAV